MTGESSYPSTIGILMPGDMGHAVGAALGKHSHTVLTCLAGRSDETRQRAERAGFVDSASLDELAEKTDLILSILPPLSAKMIARDVADAVTRTGTSLVYADCNAVSPQTARDISKIFSEKNIPFIDAGIIGASPGKGSPPRFYVSGPDVSIMTALDGKGVNVISMGAEIGRASAIKMAYAGLTKGTMTLHTAVLLAALQLGVLDELLNEFHFSQTAAVKAMQARTPRLPADAERWIGEMEEIAASFRQAGVTGDFHDGAAEIFRVLARTPFASETRETIDENRTLEDALAVYAQHLPGNKPE